MSAVEANRTHVLPTEPESPVSARFRFRLVARGERANALVVFAVKSLIRCHPNAGILLVDANDTPALKHDLFGVEGDFEIVHFPPDEDDVARAVGRGSRQHLFYWRHSPELLSALPASDRYDVYSDADIIFLRPLDLASLMSPLANGRIAAAVDESSLDHYEQLGLLASLPASRMLPAAGAGGPLLQAGLIFTNPADDGGFYDHFWHFAVNAATSGHLPDLPSDDMCIVAALLGQGGLLWERLLALGHEWNYITDAQKDPGIFGCAAHYGGHRAKAFILAQSEDLFPPADRSHPAAPWGTVARVDAAAGPALIRGFWQDRTRAPVNSQPSQGDLTVPVPFALSWLVPLGVRTFEMLATLEGIPEREHAEATFYVYVDGHLVYRLPSRRGQVHTSVHLGVAETVTIIGVSSAHGCQVRLNEPFERTAQHC